MRKIRKSDQDIVDVYKAYIFQNKLSSSHITKEMFFEDLKSVMNIEPEDFSITVTYLKYPTECEKVLEIIRKNKWSQYQKVKNCNFFSTQVSDGGFKGYILGPITYSTYKKLLSAYKEIKEEDPGAILCALNKIEIEDDGGPIYLFKYAKVVYQFKNSWRKVK